MATLVVEGVGALMLVVDLGFLFALSVQLGLCMFDAAKNVSPTQVDKNEARWLSLGMLTTSFQRRPALHHNVRQIKV